jgi:hypothetical protein
MKTREFIIDLKDAKSEQDVFAAINDAFREEIEYSKQTVKSWVGLDDCLWLFIQSPEPGEPAPYGRDIEKYEIKVINSAHLNDVRSTIQSAEKSIREALRDSFALTMREREKRVEPNDISVFKNSTLEIIS